MTDWGRVSSQRSHSKGTRSSPLDPRQPRTPTECARCSPSLKSNGLLDDTFDGPGGSGNGVFRISQGTDAFAAAIAVSGSKVIFGGSVDAHSFVYQLNDNGTLDTSGVGSPNGYLTFDFPGGSGQSFLAGLAIQQSDGKIIAVGHPNGATGMGVARITTTGALDTTLRSHRVPGGDPGVGSAYGYADGAGRGVIADPSGEILVGGYVESFIPSDNRDPAIAAVTPAGALDTAAFAGGTGYALLRPRGLQRPGQRARPATGRQTCDRRYCRRCRVVRPLGRALLRQRRSRHRLRIAGGLHDHGFHRSDLHRQHVGALEHRGRLCRRKCGLPATSGLRRSMHSPLRSRGVEAEAAARSLQRRRPLPPRRSARRRRSTGPPPRRSARSGSSPKP